MEYLAFEEAVIKKKDIADELNLLLSNKALVAKPNALQWKFLRDCANVLLNPKFRSKFSSLSNSQKAQLKYEAEDKLKKYYLRPGRKINYVFQIVHKKDLTNIFNGEADEYPHVGGYSVLIRDTSNEVTPYHNLTEKDIKEYIERIITEAVETEFDAYHTLPKIIEDDLLNSWFCPFGPAKKEIMHVLLRHKERGWILTNQMNPSTKRILNIKVKDIKKKEIFVSTTEYWYLRWWDAKRNSYAFPYRETSRQQYVLRKDDGIWKVYEAIRPSPRTSIPNRRQYL
ncbi:MAG: hypothetical protein ACYC5G_05180 [Candidatus Doudnabacteria bacterium]